MPLMMPAAVIGIHSICTAQIVSADRTEQREVDHQHHADALPGEAACRGCARSSRRACRGRTWRASRGSSLRRDRARRRAAAPCRCRASAGCAGRRRSRTLAWCLRWIATHSLVTMPVVSQSQKRKKCATTGCRSSAAMRLAAVQEDRDRGDRDVRQDQRDDDVAPPGKVDQPVSGEGQ